MCVCVLFNITFVYVFCAEYPTALTLANENREKSVLSSTCVNSGLECCQDGQSAESYETSVVTKSLVITDGIS